MKHRAKLAAEAAVYMAGEICSLSAYSSNPESQSCVWSANRQDGF